MAPVLKRSDSLDSSSGVVVLSLCFIILIIVVATTFVTVFRKARKNTEIAQIKIAQQEEDEKKLPVATFEGWGHDPPQKAYFSRFKLQRYSIQRLFMGK